MVPVSLCFVVVKLTDVVPFRHCKGSMASCGASRDQVEEFYLEGCS